MEHAQEERLRQSAVRALDDPIALNKAARIVRAALERGKLTLANLTDDGQAMP
jgi:hypothetical protein